MKPSNLRVLDAARRIVDEINQWLDDANPPIPVAEQIRESTESITANITEGWGRDPGRERNQFLRYARGSAEETNERIRSAMASGRLPESKYWSWHHRLVAISRMLGSLMEVDPRTVARYQRAKQRREVK